ncbi:MAG TPA: helix-turn-helix transcriptional regulator [Bacteroidia bacterium]|jgi:transcriptional regulator with XRE-family HTH domain|nr:helix-turn-helix transcriptional regulator [Bacteroidia bacterium]
MENLGETLRTLREQKELPLRIVAAFLDIDQAILSKIERGQRKASRKQVVKLAKYFKVNKDTLMIAWLSDKLIYELENEDLALQAMQLAEEKIKYKSKNDKH